jgi:hypothetical protein
MPSNWSDPFSVDRMAYRVGAVILIMVLGAAGMVGLPYQAIQRLRSEIAMESSVSEALISVDQWVSRIGNAGQVVVSGNQVSIECRDTETVMAAVGQIPFFNEIEQMDILLQGSRYRIAILLKELP